MLYNNLFFTFLTLITVKSCSALPSQKFPVALNLHQELSPQDVNNLSKDQKQRAAFDVQTTIDEVQKLLALDPSLPRLTKGEIKELFERVAKEELEKSILNGDHKKENYMRYLMQALPYHSEEIETLDKLAKHAATTVAPSTPPEVPDGLKTLLQQHGLIDEEGKPVELAPVTPLFISVEDETEEESKSPEELLKDIKKASFVSPKDYEAFKPLDVNKSNVTSDMESFFKQFGLVDNEESKKNKKKQPTKATKTRQTDLNIPSIDSSYLIPGYSSLLDNIGIKTIKDKSNNKKPDNIKSLSQRSNVYKPSNKNVAAADDDYKKLEQLLETIRELEKLNASLTEKEVDRLNLQNYNFSDSLLANGPDPLQYHVQYSALKNEVKRQEPKDTEPTKLDLNGPLLESSLEATDDDNNDDEKEEENGKEEEKVPEKVLENKEKEEDLPPVTEPPTEEKKNSLEDEIEPIDDPEPIPPPRRSGFYMLFDWNTFLEVGEDPEKIVVRFDPKIGDPSRFLPVNVP
ncbi:CLUMA_CG011451, isoform A [Clunio marinus]|uniref:CLUMA_CG011451, isoform A n=1 Tax=Clunio marinus TaxID=568069 RepID=A0A1J1ICZ8_9DIPT|nr:CLUMA_CG011451, isoform A [Clunio marinus]